MEIERKFLLDKLPDNLAAYNYVEIKQGYINRKPTVRIRQWDDKFILTIKIKKSKGDGPIVNIEEEYFITESAFNNLKNFCKGNIVSKRRYFIPINAEFENSNKTKNLTIELDVFSDYLDGLFFAEVEFENENDANSFVLPELFKRDVSSDNRYSNGFLSTVKSLDELGF